MSEIIIEDGRINVYHIGYSPETIDSVPDGFMLLDNSENLRPDWYEFWPIRNFLKNMPMSDNEYYGFMSPKFGFKTGLDYSCLYRFVTSSGESVDAFIICPQPEVGHVFRNVYYGSEATDFGCLDTCRKIFKKLNLKYDLDNLVNDSRNTVYSNYIVAKKSFWNAWLAVCERIFEIAENPGLEPELYADLNLKTSYGNQVQRKVFVIEGVASILLASGEFKVSSIPVDDVRRGVGAFYRADGSSTVCDALKMAYNETGDEKFLNIFDKLSDEIICKVKLEVAIKKELTMKQTPAHDLYNDSILSIIRALKSESIIEVGCMRGSLAREYLKDHPSAEWTGIDIDPENVSHAQKICHHAIRADIEKLTLSTLPNIQNVDAWVLGDVLEHLRDPWGLLRRIREASPSNATVIACIPNSQHWSFQVRVNSGMMQYQDDGLFDRTHLRFFSRTTIVQMFQEAGYTIKSMHSRSFNFPGFEKYLPSIRTMASLSGVDPDQAQADALAFQYVVEAVRAE